MPAQLDRQAELAARRAKEAYAKHYGLDPSLVTDPMVRDSRLGFSGWADVGRVPGPYTAPDAERASPVSAEALLAAALARLVRAPADTTGADSSGMGWGSLAADASPGMWPGMSLPGAKGMASVDRLRTDFERRPGRYTQAVRENLRHALNRSAAPVPASPDQMCQYMAEQVTFPDKPGARQPMIFMTFGLALCFDQIQAGRWEEAEDTISRLCVAADQWACDGGRGDFFWKLTFLPEPPWSRLLKPAAGMPPQSWAGLACPEWVTSHVAMMRDRDAIADGRKLAKEPKDPKHGKDPPPKKGGTGEGGNQE